MMTFDTDRRPQPQRRDRARGRHTLPVTVDGHSTLVDAVRIGDFALSLVVVATRDRAVKRKSCPRGLVVTSWCGSTAGSQRPASTDDARGGTRRCRSRESGRAIDRCADAGARRSVLVGPGDEVTARQPVVVVEAMKMENGCDRRKRAASRTFRSPWARLSGRPRSDIVE